jgi:hypothetical protein
VHEPHAAHHGSSAYLSILFLFVALILGSITEYATSRHCHNLPYTCTLLVEGIFIGAWFEWTGYGGSTLVRDTIGARITESVEQWLHIDPHLLLYAFLPALLFGDTMSLNMHMVGKCFWQCWWLAFPGVIFGTVLTGAVAKYILPYGWGWEFSLMFGSILAATDPVAVVSLLKSLGASPKLTMLITGESLMNDGAAIVMFNLFLSMYKVGAHHIAC